MTKNHEFTVFERGEIIGLFKDEYNVRKIAEILRHLKSIV